MDYEKTVRDALITLFNADAAVKEAGTLGLLKWWKRVEDGFVGRRSPFGYVEFQRRIAGPGSDMGGVGYIYVYEVGIVGEGKTGELSAAADDVVTALLDGVETVLIANRTVTGNVDDLAVPLEKEFARLRMPDRSGDISWGVLTVGFKKKIAV